MPLYYLIFTIMFLEEPDFFNKERQKKDNHNMSMST